MSCLLGWMIISVAYWSSILVDCLIIWIQIYRVDWSSMDMIMLAYVSLAKLIKNWSWSLCVNRWYLCHYLSIIGMGIVLIFTSSRSTRSFSWTDLRWTWSFAMRMATFPKLFTLSSSIRRRAIILVAATNARSAHLLIIMNPYLLQVVSKMINSIPVTGI